MHEELIKNSSGKPVTDVFGRRLGYAVGSVFKINGELGALGVDLGDGNFVEYPVNQFIVGEEGFVLVPSWKLESQGIRAEKATLERRSRALNNESESDTRVIPKKTREAMQKQLDSVRESHQALIRKIGDRMEQLNKSDEALNNFLASIQLQLASGETDESSHKFASEYCRHSKEANKKESEELDAVMRILNGSSPSGSNTEAHSDDTKPVQPVQPVVEQKMAEFKMSVGMLRPRFRKNSFVRSP